MAAFGEVLKVLRARADMTQAELSRDAGLSLGIVRDYEQGRKEPSLRSACHLADALGVSVEAFRDCIDAVASAPAGPTAKRAADNGMPSAKRAAKRKEK